MDTYSSLNRTGPLSPGSTGVWKIQKKRKADDRKRQNGQKEQGSKKEKEAQDTTSVKRHEKDGIVVHRDTEEQPDHGSTMPEKQIRNKIDLTI